LEKLEAGPGADGRDALPRRQHPPLTALAAQAEHLAETYYALSQDLLDAADRGKMFHEGQAGFVGTSLGVALRDLQQLVQFRPTDPRPAPGTGGGAGEQAP
jgi:hypothetical protein